MHVNDSFGEDIAASQILHPGSRKLFANWEALRAERPCPTRDEFAFGPVRQLVPDLVVLERDNIRRSFRYRLAGSRVCDLFRKNLTGTDALHGWDNFEREVISRHLNQTLNAFQPTVLRMRLATDTGDTVAAEFIGLPFSRRGSATAHIIAGLFPFRPSAGLEHGRIVARDLIAIRTLWTEFQAKVPAQPELAETAAFPYRVIKGGRD